MAWMIVCTPFIGFAKTVYHTGFAERKAAEVWGRAHQAGNSPCEIVRSAAANGLTCKVEPVQEGEWTRLHGRPVR